MTGLGIVLLGLFALGAAALAGYARGVSESERDIDRLTDLAKKSHARE